MKKLDMGDSHFLIDIIKQEFSSDSLQDLRIAEVGVYRGDLSRQLLKEFPDSKLWMIDWWSVYHLTHSYRQSKDACALQTAEQQDENRKHAIKNCREFKDRIFIYADGSVNAALYAANKHELFDVVFIDASHVYEDVVIDLAIWFPLVRSGGVFAGHDIDHPKDKRGVWGVRRAVERFCRDNQLTFKTMGTCWWIVKP